MRPDSDVTVTRDMHRDSRVTGGVTCAVSHGTPSRPGPARPFKYLRLHASNVCRGLAALVNFMHASSLSYPSSSPTLHAESSTIEHLDEDWQPRCTTRAVNLRTGVKRTCTAPAKWFHVCGVCSLDGYSCDRCRRHAIERARCYGCMRWIADYWVWRPL